MSEDLVGKFNVNIATTTVDGKTFISIDQVMAFLQTMKDREVEYRENNEQVDPT